MYRLKLNPILGETLQGQFNDGTQVYCEQFSHHPPVSNEAKKSLAFIEIVSALILFRLFPCDRSKEIVPVCWLL